MENQFTGVDKGEEWYCRPVAAHRACSCHSRVGRAAEEHKAAGEQMVAEVHKAVEVHKAAVWNKVAAGDSWFAAPKDNRC